jgi:hypothetical protein
MFRPAVSQAKSPSDNFAVLCQDDVHPLSQILMQTFSGFSLMNS